jgi:hypothetical protein
VLLLNRLLEAASCKVYRAGDMVFREWTYGRRSSF